MNNRARVKTWAAIVLIMLGVVATLAAQVPTLISSPSYLWLMNSWLGLTILGLILLAVGTFVDQGQPRRIGLVLVGTALLIAALSIGRYFMVLNHEVF